MKNAIILTTIALIFISCATNKFQGPKIGPGINREIASDANDPEIYPYRVHSDMPHDMRIINNGIAALYQRVKMIREAQKSLELEYFIFNPDLAGKIIITELIKAQKRGVKVRILIDKSLAVFKLDEYYAKVLKANNIELRYYNPASPLQISTVQFRDHRKLIVRDDQEAMTGGRNIAVEYFNLAEKFNFLDRDIWVKGEVVKSMRETFDLYWNSKIVQIPSETSLPKKKLNSNPKFQEQTNAEYNAEVENYYKKTNAANVLLSVTDEDQRALDFIVSYGEKALSESDIHECPSVAFATDREGGDFLVRLKSKDYNTNYRLLRKEIAYWMGKVEDQVILDSPYFLNDANSREILDDLLKNNKKVTILTNSLASTDAIYVSTVFSEEVKKYTPNENFNAYIYKGIFSNESEVYNDKIRNSMWGTHSKTMIFNNNSFMIGTFNVDNRSNFYNSEMAIFCSKSSELTSDIEDNIKVRMKTSHHLNKKGLPDDGTKLLEGNTTMKKLEYFLLKVPASIMQFLM